MPPVGNQTFSNTVNYYEDPDLVQCPYMAIHQIRPERLARHLVKCRKDLLEKPTHPDHKRAKAMVVCQYNQVHHIPRQERQQHELECPDRLLFRPLQEMKTTPTPIVPTSTAKAAPISDFLHESGDEDWDAEVAGLNLGTYDPRAKMVGQGIPINTQNRGPAERREIRALQRVGDTGAVSQRIRGGMGEGVDQLTNTIVGLSVQQGGKKKKKKAKKPKSDGQV